MRYPRFRVATVSGYAIGERADARRGGNAAPGLSASVCDSLYGWRVLRTYRSEDFIFRGDRPTTRGVEGALQDATDEAAYLNEVETARLATERQRHRRAMNGARG